MKASPHKDDITSRSKLLKNLTQAKQDRDAKAEIGSVRSVTPIIEEDGDEDNEAGRVAGDASSPTPSARKTLAGNPKKKRKAGNGGDDVVAKPKRKKPKTA